MIDSYAWRLFLVDLDADGHRRFGAEIEGVDFCNGFLHGRLERQMGAEHYMHRFTRFFTFLDDRAYGDPVFAENA